MKKLLALLFLWSALSCRADAVDVRGLFDQAGREYDAGQFKTSAESYERILQSGYVAPELLFNLGNAYFKMGNTGKAILNYRSAWTMAPRDAELSANLRFALQSSGASAPDESVVAHVLSRASFREWIELAMMAYWLACAFGIIHFIVRTKRPVWLRSAGACALIAVVSVAGALNWKPEWVVTTPGQQALFAPLDNSTPHFALPPGSIVRPLEVSGNWLKVALGNDSGWIRQSSARPVSSWQMRPAP